MTRHLTIFTLLFALLGVPTTWSQGYKGAGYVTQPELQAAIDAAVVGGVTPEQLAAAIALKANTADVDAAAAAQLVVDGVQDSAIALKADTTYADTLNSISPAGGELAVNGNMYLEGYRIDLDGGILTGPTDPHGVNAGLMVGNMTFNDGRYTTPSYVSTALADYLTLAAMPGYLSPYAIEATVTADNDVQNTAIALKANTADTDTDNALQNAAIALKADKADELDPADFATAAQGTDADTAYLHAQTAHAPAGAEVNVQADWTAGAGDSFILNKPTLGTAAAEAVGVFATAAQGLLADDAAQFGDNVQILLGEGTGAENFTELQAAISAAEAAGGFQFILIQGTYDVSANVNMYLNSPSKGVFIRGLNTQDVTRNTERGCELTGFIPTATLYSTPPHSIMWTGFNARGGLSGVVISGNLEIGSGMDVGTGQNLAFEDLVIKSSGMLAKGNNADNASFRRISIEADAGDCFLNGYLTGYYEGIYTAKAYVGISGTTAGSVVRHCTSTTELLNGIMAGVVENCTGGNNSFGGGLGIGISGTARLINCTGGNNCFGQYGSIAAGAYLEGCEAGDKSFAYYGNIEDGAEVRNCVGGDLSFSFFGNISGLVVGCTAGASSFAGGGGAQFNDQQITSTGEVRDCVAGNDSFGRMLVAGTLYNCRATTGHSFSKIGASTGKMYQCIGVIGANGFTADDKNIRNCIEE